jgi:hypothetical protein
MQHTALAMAQVGMPAGNELSARLPPLGALPDLCRPACFPQAMPVASTTVARRQQAGAPLRASPVARRNARAAARQVVRSAAGQQVGLKCTGYAGVKGRFARGIPPAACRRQWRQPSRHCATCLPLAAGWCTTNSWLKTFELLLCTLLPPSLSPLSQVTAAAVEAPAQQLDWEALATEMDGRSPLEIMDHVSGSCGCLC